MAHALLGLVATLCILGGAWNLAPDSSGVSQPYRSAAGLVLVGCGLWQFLLLRKMLLRGDRLKAFALGFRSPYWRWQVTGVAASYALALAAGPNRGAAFVFQAAVVVWSTAVLAGFSRAGRSIAARPVGRMAPPEQTCRRGVLRQCVHVPIAAASWGLFAAVLVAGGLELALRAIEPWSREPAPVANFIRRQALPPDCEFRGRRANTFGYWDSAMTVEASSRPRVAVLGDELTLAGDGATNFIAQLENALLDCDVMHFGVRGASPREYAVMMAGDVAACRPRLVVVVVNLFNDATHRAELPGAFDWQGLRLLEWGIRAWRPELLAAASPPEESPGETDYEALIASAADGVAPLLTPIPRERRHLWEETLAELEAIAAAAGDASAEIVFALVPSRLQLDRSLREAVLARRGLRAEEVDVELPQRTLAVFARERGLAVCDLTREFAEVGGGFFERNSLAWHEAGHRAAAAALRDVIRHRLGREARSNAVARFEAGN